MKTIELIFFCSLLACKLKLAKSDNQRNYDSPPEEYLKVKSSKQNSRKSSLDQSYDTSDVNKDSINSTVRREPNVFQKVLVPVGGPYCYPEVLDVDLKSDKISRRKTGLTFSPQQWDESLEIKMISLTPRGTIEGEWPYQRGQSRKKEEIRKYIKLNVSFHRKKENYRLTGVDAERAFISRYYGFINPSENSLTDDIITFIDNTEKIGSHLLLDPEPDPLADFNSREMEDKIKFCEDNINYSIVLFKQNIDFDKFRSDQIIRTQKTVRYKNSHLQSYIDTVDIVVCPCVEIITDTSLELGILPIRYKYKQEYPYIFVYNILNNVNNVEDFNDVNVRALTKIDVKGLWRKRKHRNRKQQKKLEKKAEEDRKIQAKMDRKEKKENEANENGEGKMQRVLSKLLSSRLLDKII